MPEDPFAAFVVQPTREEDPFASFEVNNPEPATEEPGILQRSWDWLTSPVEMFEPFIESQTNKIASMVPEGEYRDAVANLTRENIGGVLSPLSFIGEAAAGLHFLPKILRGLRGASVIPEVAPEVARTPKLLEAFNPTGTQLSEVAGEYGGPLHRLTRPTAPLEAAEITRMPDVTIDLTNNPTVGAIGENVLGQPRVGGRGELGVRGTPMFPSVPERLQTSPNQQVMGSLSSPRSLTRPGETVVETKFIPQPGREEVTRGLTSEAQAARDEALSNVDEWGRILQTDSNPVVQSAGNSGIPEVQQAAQQVVSSRPPLSSSAQSASRRAYDKAFTSGWTILNNMGEKGKELSRFLRRTRADAASEAGTILSKYKPDIEDLSQKEFEQAVDLLESGGTSNNAKIQKGITAMRSMLDETGDLAEKEGVLFSNPSGQLIPFQKMAEGYFPHKWAPGTFDEGSLINQLVSEGMSADQARFVVQQGIKTGPHLLSPQHMRSLNLQGYLKTKGALYEHVDDLVTKAIETREFGARDLGDKTSKLSSLVDATEDPELALDIVRDQLGRTSHDPDLTHVANSINTFEATVKLPLFAISNMNQAAAIGMRNSTGNFLKGLANTIKGVSSAEDTGALQTTALNVLKETGQNPVTRFANKAFGWQKSEEFLRSWAGNAGRAQADSLFAKLKKNPLDQEARAQLDDLLLEDVNKVLSQESLTDKQRKIAGFRMSELTQGLVDPADLPPLWNKNPLLKIPLMFKRFAFQQNRILKQALESAPTPAAKAKLAGKLLGLYAVTGEVTGDAKKAITAAAKGEDPLKAIEERGGGMDRVLNDLSNAYALGLMGEIIGQAGSGSAERILEFVTGPFFSDLANVGAGAGKAFQQGNLKPLGKELIRLTPLGYSTQDLLFPSGGSKPIMGGS